VLLVIVGAQSDGAAAVPTQHHLILFSLTAVSSLSKWLTGMGCKPPAGLSHHTKVRSRTLQNQIRQLTVHKSANISRQLCAQSAALDRRGDSAIKEFISCSSFLLLCLSTATFFITANLV